MLKTAPRRAWALLAVGTVVSLGVVAVVIRNRARTMSSPSASPSASGDSSAPWRSARVVCAPVQGPTRRALPAPRVITEESPHIDDVVSSSDGTIALRMAAHEDGGRHVSTVELVAPGAPTQRVRVPGNDDPYLPQVVFRGANVIGFGARKSPVLGGDGYVVWATLKPLAIVARPVGWNVERAGSRIYFSDPKCVMHWLDLETGADHSGGTKVCSWFRVWGDAIAIGKPKDTSGHVTGIDFGGTLVDADTGKPRQGPHCPNPVGKACITFDSDLHEDTNDDPPGPASSAQRETFEVRGAQGERLRGETAKPHSSLSPHHCVLWRTPSTGTLALVALRVEGSERPQLVVVEESRVVVTPLSPEDAVDQRRIAALRTFVPASTHSEDVDALVAERAKVLATSANDPVRFMESAAAASAHTPCTAPPP